MQTNRRRRGNVPPVAPPVRRVEVVQVATEQQAEEVYLPSAVADLLRPTDTTNGNNGIDKIALRRVIIAYVKTVHGVTFHLSNAMLRKALGISGDLGKVLTGLELTEVGRARAALLPVRLRNRLL